MASPFGSGTSSTPSHAQLPSSTPQQVAPPDPSPNISIRSPQVGLLAPQASGMPAVQTSAPQFIESSILDSPHSDFSNTSSATTTAALSGFTAFSDKPTAVPMPQGPLSAVAVPIQLPSSTPRQVAPPGPALNIGIRSPQVGLPELQGSGMPAVQPSAPRFIDSSILDYPRSDFSNTSTATTTAAPSGFTAFSDKPTAIPMFHEPQSAVVVQIDEQSPENPTQPGQATETPPLIFAARHNRTDEVKSLLLDGADINVIDYSGWTPLMTAASKGHIDVLSILQHAAGIQFNATSSEGFTALMLAAGIGHADCVRLLVEAGASLNQSKGQTGWTAIMYAAWNGHTKIVHYLLTVNPRQSDHDLLRDCKEMLSFVAKNGCTGVVDTVFSKINALCSDLDETHRGKLMQEIAEKALMSAAKKGHTDTVIALIKCGLNVNATKPDGITVLMWALMHGRDATAKALVGLKANVEATMPDGKTLLMYAGAHRKC